MQYDALLSEYFIELLRCALHGKIASAKPKEVSWDDLFEYAKSQSLTSLAYSAITASGFDLREKLAQKWSERNALNIVAHFNQEHECVRLCERFSEAGIMHMPLKGSAILSLLTNPELREMCDLDILIKPEDADRAHEIMLSDGYSFIEDHTTSHNREYHKLPHLNVELHTYLVPTDNRMFSYYADFWDKVRCEDGSLTCHMSWDDCYIYMLAHVFKHFFQHGTGIRSAIDIYVMRDKLKNVLNRDYIIGELKKLEIFDFAERFERLADCLFAVEKTEIPQELQIYYFRMLESGTYGVVNRMKAKALMIMEDGRSFHAAKRKMAIEKLFPPYPYMKKLYPCLKYVPFLLPLFWLIRWVGTLLVKPKRISEFFGKLKRLSLPGERKERR